VWLRYVELPTREALNINALMGIKSPFWFQFLTVYQRLIIADTEFVFVVYFSVSINQFSLDSARVNFKTMFYQVKKES
ncbi:MAG: hypothetical protein ACJAW2_001605, partial [Shewanella sp.]